MRRLTAIFLAMITTAVTLVAAPPTAWAVGSPAATRCAQYTVPVTVSATDPTLYNVVGQMCISNDAIRGMQTVELFVPGLTYDHNYFDLSYQPNDYSFVSAATSRGYSTFNVDRLGVGLSDHPPAEKLTLEAHAYVIGQLVQKLRVGAIGGRAFTNVVGVGHSFGAAALQYLAGTATNAATVPNYLVLGSFLMTTYGPGLTALGNALYPATSDPAFASSGLPSGYITTMPNTRGSVFFHAAGSLPALVALDESTKQTGTLAERVTLADARNPAITRGVKVPVLMTVGQFDNLYCNEASGLACATSAAVKTREAPNWAPKACLDTYVVGNAGHSTGLHVTAHDSYNYVHTWLDNYTINYANAKDTNGCLLWLQPPSGNSRLNIGAQLTGGQNLTSPNGRFRLTMQPDGNLVISDNNAPMWATGTWNLSAEQKPTHLDMQSDGNLVLYNNTHQAAWASGSSGSGRVNPYLEMQDDGNLVIYHNGRSPLWASDTIQ